MQLLLGEGEQVIHSWDYAIESKLVGFKRKHSLTLTNKRIVQTETLKRGINRKDFLVDNITGVEVSTDRSIKAASIILAILCAIFAVIIFFTPTLFIDEDSTNESIKAVCIIFGIVLLMLAILFYVTALNSNLLTISIYTDSIPTAITGVISKRYKASNTAIKLKVNKQYCQEIAENLSKLILIDLKNTK